MAEKTVVLAVVKYDGSNMWAEELDRDKGRGESLYSILKHGYVWDGDLISKSYRDDLVAAGLVQRSEGYNFLTKAGVMLCVSMGWLRS